MKIAVVACYIGKLPWYFPYFLHSCKHNPSIDFIVITNDSSFSSPIPANVRLIYKTLPDLNVLFCQKLGFSVNIKDGYKLCDFKPAYGFLFNEIVEDYDFWGHADIDVIFGQIRNFMTDELLNSYDVISSRHDYITGSFCLFRNYQQINELFKNSKHYRMVFSSQHNFCFDECNYLFAELQNGGSIFDYLDNIESMTYVVQKAANEGKLKAFFDFIIVEGTPGKVKWENGKIIYKNLYEAMYYHLIKFKECCKNKIVFNPIPDVFYFTPTRILKMT